MNTIIYIKLLTTFITILIQFVIVQSQPIKNNRRITRIANGNEFPQNYYPYVVGLEIKDSYNQKKTCTGTLLSPLFVLTAAHCIVENNTIMVFQNDRNNQLSEKRYVVEFFKHSAFNETSMVADLCLLKMNESFENITSYAIISGNPELFANKTTLKCVVLGWGKNEFSVMSYRANVASVRVKYGPDACEVPPDNNFIKNIVQSTWEEFLCPIPDSQMVCVGDSGGALICQGFLFGVTSHSYNYFPGMNYFKTICGDNRVQTRHIFIYKYQKWINNIIYNVSSTTECNNLLIVLMFWLWFFA